MRRRYPASQTRFFRLFWTFSARQRAGSGNGAERVGVGGMVLLTLRGPPRRGPRPCAGRTFTSPKTWGGEDELLTDAVCHAVQIGGAVFLLHPGVEAYLEGRSPKAPLSGGPGFLVDGLHGLVGLLRKLRRMLSWVCSASQGQQPPGQEDTDDLLQVLYAIKFPYTQNLS